AMDRSYPDQDLRPAYQKLVAANEQDPDALYLLARIEYEDLDAGQRMFRKAADAGSAYAMAALGQEALERAEFQEAARWFEESHPKAPTNMPLTLSYYRTRMAAGKFKELLDQLHIERQHPGRQQAAWEGIIVAVHAAKGEYAKAGAAISEAAKGMEGADD